MLLLLLKQIKGYEQIKHFYCNIAFDIGVDRNTVNQYVSKLQSIGKSFDELLRLDEIVLQKLSPSKEALDGDRYAVLYWLLPGFINEV